ncbi:hypothetical protein Dda_7869 [Drechslerella dactyloides]|uniref:Uncharacterized protein n=1 Tax=Drechslerella dactyloides TaxID=74499 RepID=A0AAD6IRB7_DREDA|nr:hypothetical protein Dda_7869 [Drechslerella dactyloides]
MPFARKYFHSCLFALFYWVNVELLGAGPFTGTLFVYGRSLSASHQWAEAISHYDPRGCLGYDGMATRDSCIPERARIDSSVSDVSSHAKRADGDSDTPLQGRATNSGDDDDVIMGEDGEPARDPFPYPPLDDAQVWRTARNIGVTQFKNIRKYRQPDNPSKDRVYDYARFMRENYNTATVENPVECPENVQDFLEEVGRRGILRTPVPSYWTTSWTALQIQAVPAFTTVSRSDAHLIIRWTGPTLIDDFGKIMYAAWYSRSRGDLVYITLSQVFNPYTVQLIKMVLYKVGLELKDTTTFIAPYEEDRQGENDLDYEIWTALLGTAEIGAIQNMLNANTRYFRRRSILSIGVRIDSRSDSPGSPPEAMIFVTLDDPIPAENYRSSGRSGISVAVAYEAPYSDAFPDHEAFKNARGYKPTIPPLSLPIELRRLASLTYRNITFAWQFSDIDVPMDGDEYVAEFDQGKYEVAISGIDQNIVLGGPYPTSNYKALGEIIYEAWRSKRGSDSLKYITFRNPLPGATAILKEAYGPKKASKRNPMIIWASSSSWQSENPLMQTIPISQQIDDSIIKKLGSSLELSAVSHMLGDKDRWESLGSPYIISIEVGAEDSERYPFMVRLGNWYMDRATLEAEHAKIYSTEIRLPSAGTLTGQRAAERPDYPGQPFARKVLSRLVTGIDLRVRARSKSEVSLLRRVANREMSRRHGQNWRMLAKGEQDRQNRQSEDPFIIISWPKDEDEESEDSGSSDGGSTPRGNRNKARDTPKRLGNGAIELMKAVVASDNPTVANMAYGRFRPRAQSLPDDILDDESSTYEQVELKPRDEKRRHGLVTMSEKHGHIIIHQVPEPNNEGKYTDLQLCTALCLAWEHFYNITVDPEATPKPKAPTKLVDYVSILRVSDWTRNFLQELTDLYGWDSELRIEASVIFAVDGDVTGVGYTEYRLAQQRTFLLLHGIPEVAAIEEMAWTESKRPFIGDRIIDEIYLRWVNVKPADSEVEIRTPQIFLFLRPWPPSDVAASAIREVGLNVLDYLRASNTSAVMIQGLFLAEVTAYAVPMAIQFGVPLVLPTFAMWETDDWDAKLVTDWRTTTSFPLKKLLHLLNIHPARFAIRVDLEGPGLQGQHSGQQLAEDLTDETLTLAALATEHKLETLDRRYIMLGCVEKWELWRDTEYIREYMAGEQLAQDLKPPIDIENRRNLMIRIYKSILQNPTLRKKPYHIFGTHYLSPEAEIVQNEFLEVREKKDCGWNGYRFMSKKLESIGTYEPYPLFNAEYIAFLGIPEISSLVYLGLMTFPSLARGQWFLPKTLMLHCMNTGDNLEVIGTELAYYSGETGKRIDI